MKRLEGIVSDFGVKTPKIPAPVVAKNTSLDAIGAYAYSPAPKLIVKRESSLKKYLLIGFASVVVGMTAFGIVKLISPEKVSFSYEEIFVQQGDTYWGLVRQANPDYRGDIRELVYYAQQANGELMAFTKAMIPVVE